MVIGQYVKIILMTNRLKNLLSIGFIFFIVAVFFSPYFLNKSIPYVGDFTGSDLTELNLPLRYLTSQAYKNFEIPVWTNLLSNGFPILEEGQSGVFYPLNIILYLLFPFFVAVNLSLALNFFLSGFFTYLYARQVKLSYFASVLSAIAFSFSGFFIFRLKHVNLVNAAIWLPLLFLLVEKFFVAKKKSLVIALIPVVLAVQFFAGHPQIVFVSVVSMFLYFAIRFFDFYNLETKVVLRRLVAPWLAVVVLFLCLAAVQIIPTFLFSATSGRSLSMGYNESVLYSYNLKSLASFVNPYVAGNPAFRTSSLNLAKDGVFWEDNIYFGVLPFLLALVGFIFVSVRKKEARVLSVLFFVSFLFILGEKSPLFILFWEYIPGFSLFRFHQRFLLLTLLSLSVLSGFGFDYLYKKYLDNSHKFKYLKKSKLLNSFLLPVLVVVIACVDLFIVSFQYLGLLNYDKYFSPPESAELVKQDEEFRVYSMKWPTIWQETNRLADGWQNNMSLFISEREVLPPNLNVFWDVPSQQDRASIEGGLLSRYNHELTNVLINQTWVDADENGEIEISQGSLNALGVANVKYLLSYDKLSNENLTLVKEIKRDFFPALSVYENKSFQNFARGVFDVRRADDPLRELEIIFSDDFDPSREVVLDGGNIDESDVEGRADILVKDEGDGKVFVEANFTKSGYLVLAQTYLPGWTATVDGQRAEVLRANFAYSAVELEAGKHMVEFSYKPKSFAIGKWVSLITFVLLVLYIFIYSIYESRFKTK